MAKATLEQVAAAEHAGEDFEGLREYGREYAYRVAGEDEALRAEILTAWQHGFDRLVASDAKALRSEAARLGVSVEELLVGD